MGEDKGTKSYKSRLWVDVLINRINNFSDVYISVGNHNKDIYIEEGYENLILDLDIPDVSGPIRGVLSAKQQLSTYDKILIIPCDMIMLKTLVLFELTKNSRSSIYTAQGNDFPLPICLSKSDFITLQKMEVKGRSLQSILAELNVAKIETDVPDTFLNFNSQEDLKALS